MAGNNQRLAKNTIMLYFRMIFLMVVTLYTSRVTLQVLGVDDFGTYNIIGGVVVLFAFLARSLNSACTRYLSVAVGKQDTNEIQKTFSTALVAHFFLMLVVTLLLETIGLWFVYNKLNIPEGRESAAIIIYHIAVLSVCLNIIRTPFNASIIANEKMVFYAYTSIVEGVLKLVICWILLVIPMDKLISYSLLVMLTILAINVWYVGYCITKLKGNKIILQSDKSYMTEMLTFSGWNLFGGIADIGWQQGTNIILNMFHGVSLNTAMGITNQVRTAVYSFVANLQTAANPQIIKSYANNDREHFMTLVYSISKYSFYLMLLFSIPLIVNIDFILKLWLGTVPSYASSFCVLILIISTIDAVSGPLWVSIQATGDVKYYSVFVSLILLLNLPATYYLFANGYAPEAMLMARILILIISLVWQFLYARHKVNFSGRKYFVDVVLPLSLVTIIACSATYLLSAQLDDGWKRLIVTTICSTIVLLVCVYLLGINKGEREIINKWVTSKSVWIRHRSSLV